MDNKEIKNKDLEKVQGGTHMSGDKEAYLDDIPDFETKDTEIYFGTIVGAADGAHADIKR